MACHLTQLVDDRFRHGRVFRLVDDHDANGAVAVPAQREGGDIDAMATEDGADLADDAGLVVVAGDDHRSLEWRLNGHAINEYQSRHTSLEQRAFDAPLTHPCVQLD
jgi:hypothetical protein